MRLPCYERSIFHFHYAVTDYLMDYGPFSRLIHSIAVYPSIPEHRRHSLAVYSYYPEHSPIPSIVLLVLHCSIGIMTRIPNITQPHSYTNSSI